MTEIRLDGQSVIVTGAGRGLGRAYALELAHRGAAVVINDVAVNEDGKPRADTVVAEIDAAGGRAVADDSDIATSAGAESLIATAVESFGRIDAVVNNAGFLRTGTIEELSDEDMESVVAVHLLAAMYTTRAAWPHMKMQGYGRIVFTSSSSSFGHAGNGNYGAAKGGLIALARTLALEGADLGIKVNSVLPYAVSEISTGTAHVGDDPAGVRALLNALTPRRSPETVAPLTVYLASNDCRVSGEAFSALAGRYARIVYGLTDGWISPNADATAEDIAAHLDEVLSLDSFSIPTMIRDEITDVADRLRTRGLI
ncbi:SDR family NAD(P)-dependent oxidoreductase [Microbacterium sp. A196]|uniref:SDR family NAD(P)-dependent oxidoreductase n=1 Tax=Microbacterium sp. A196 TaxID=3457320 RepID=UPI003FD0CAC5